MYKLENNVEWTEDLKNAFKHNVTRAKIKYIKNNQTYYINYGNFIVNEPPENDSTNGTIKIVAYDYMIKFNKTYRDEIPYPCTLKAYLLNICSQANVELGSQSFTNDGFMVTDNQFEGKQLREILQHIGKCAFSWVRIGQDNKLYLDFKVNDENAITETITIDDYKQDAYKKANEYYGPINKVTYGDSDIQGQEISVPTVDPENVKELVINDNYFAYTKAKRQQLIQGGTVLFGLKYMPITQLDLIGFVYLDCNDLIEVLDEEGNSIISRVFSHTIKYNGAISDNIETEGISINEETYKNKNTTSASNSRTEIIVDRANKRITEVAEEVGQYDSRITKVEQDVDGIKQQVQNAVDYKRTVEGVTQIHLTEAMQQDALEVEIRGNKTYISELYPSEDLYPSSDLYINMEGEELR